MVRFFALEPVSPADRDALRALSSSFSASDAFVPMQRWNVDDDRVAAFLAVASLRGVRVFHDAVFLPPPTGTRCAGSEMFGNALQKKLQAEKHPLNGEGALIIIADGGVYAQELTAGLGMTFDRDVVGPASRSSGPRTHGTMCALDAYLAAPKARFGDLHVANGEMAVASDLFSGFSELWRGLTKKEHFPGYNACVVSVSMYVPVDSATVDMALPPTVRLMMNELHPLWAATRSLGENGFDVLVAAGNDGCEQGAVKGLALHPSVLTIGAVDGNRIIEPRSSRGLANQKPDFSTYANFLWSQMFGPGTYDSGTSASTALAAGLIASLRSSSPATYRQNLPPNKLRDYLRPRVGKITGTGQTLTAHSTEYGWGIL